MGRSGFSFGLIAQVFRRKSVLLCLVALGACGPVSPKRAADICADRARAATGPTGEAKIGVGNEGVITGVEIGVSSDFLLRRDPAEVYDSCVRQMTGKGPIRPLVL